MAGASADAEAAAARINHEQLFHEIEHKYVLLKSDFAVVERERDVAVEQKTDIATKLKDLQVMVSSRDAAIVQLNDELLKLRTERDQLGFQTKTAQSQAERRLNDVEELQQTLKEQSKQLIEAQRREVEALQKAAEQESLVEPLQHSVNRVNKELEANKQHLDWMEKQLAEKTKLVQELRQSSSKITLDHEELQSRHADELASLRKQLESARQVSKKLESSLVQAKEHVKEVQASRMHEEERLHNELSAQRRLADLYKESAADASTRVNELQQLSESLRESLSQSEEALAHQEERTKQQVEHIFREQAATSEQRIEALQEELKQTKERLEEVQKSKLFSLRTASTMAEMSSAASAAHLAANGVSPKELCDQILALEEELRTERDEKEELKIYMQRIVKEVNERAPMMMGQKLDLERLQQSNEQLSERYESCMQELVNCRAREHQAVQDKHSFQRKCDALAKSVDDLSRQVQHMLFRAHESSQSSVTAGEAASENLVVFKDVEELQIRNQQLLMVIRELTEASKNASNPANLILSGESDADSDADTTTMSVPSGSKRLKTALKEIEELRNEREEERQMIAAIVKQRDMYRVLLAQADTKFVEVSEAKATAPPSQDGPSLHHRASSDVAALRELQKEFDTYKKEKQANMKMIQDALERTRSECSSFRLGQMQAEVESKCNKDRFEAAEKRLLGADEEISRLRGKFDHANTLLVQHQRLLSESEAKLQVALTQVRALEVEKSSAIREVSFMKKNEEKTLQELSTLRLDNSNLLKLMDTNRQIDNSREERERRDLERLTQKLTVLENKLQESYDKLESSEALSAAKFASEERAKTIATKELVEVKDHLSSVREQLARVEEQLAATKSKCATQEKEVEHLREQLRKGATAAAAERVASLEVELRQSQREVQSAVEAKKSLTEGVVKFKAIAEASEQRFNEMSSANEKWKIEHDAKLKALQAERDALRGELDKARSQIKDDVTEGNKLREQIDQVTRTHQTAIQQSQERQRQLQFEAESARAELTALQQEVTNLREDVSTAQENYERELKLHASQIEKFSASRKLVQEEQAKNRALLSEVGELKARVAVAEKEAIDKIASLENLVADASQSKSSLAEQNKLLHSQLERANHQLRRAHEAEMVKTIGESSAASSGASATVSDREHNKELDDLRSVIAYLRKEGEILTSKHELAFQESQRYRAQVSMLETTVDRLRDEIKRLEESAKSGSPIFVDPSESAKQGAQLEQLDLLRESNATLREECHKYGVRVKAEEERVKSLEAQLGPLRNSEALLKSQIESLKQEIVSADATTKMWKQRVEQLVEKYQQIDPAEHEKVCAEKAAATKELAELQAKESALRAELDTLKSTDGKALEDEKAKADNWHKSYEKIKGFAKTWKSKADGFAKQLAEKTKEVEEKIALSASLEKKIAQAMAEKSALESKITTLEAGKAVGAAGAAQAVAANAAWDKERQDLQERIDAETKRVTSMKEMNGRLLAGVKKMKQENTELKGQLAAAQAQSAGAAPTPGAPSQPTQATPPPPPVAVTQPAVTATAPITAATSAPASVIKTPAATATAPAPQTKPPVVVVPTPATQIKQPVVVNKGAAAPPVAPPVAAPAPLRSPPRAPVPAPVTVPTLKATSAPFVPVAAAVAAPVATNLPPKAPDAAPAKPAVALATPVIAPPPVNAPAPAPATATATATASAPAPAPAAAAVAVAVAAPAPASSEDALRLVALRSMKKLKPVTAIPAAKPIGGVPATITPTLETKPPLPVASAPKPADEKPAAAVNPFAAAAPATGGFGTFGAGGASGLVFGTPGIKLPVPASPTPVAVASATSTAFSSIASATTTTTSSTTVDAVPVVSGETEAQRRSQRLARFGDAPAAPAVPSTLKRPATSDPEAATPQKVAKLTNEDQSATETAAALFDSQETEDENAEADATNDDTPPTPAA